MTVCRLEELLIDVLAGMLDGLAHVAVGAASPIPGAAALLARERSGGRMRVSVLGSERHNPFTDGNVELFDCAAQGGSTPSSWAAARSTARPTSTSWACAAIRRAKCGGRAVRLCLHVLHGAARDPVPPGAYAPRTGTRGGVHQRPRHQPGRGVPPGWPARVGDGPVRVRVRPAARPLPTAQRPSGAHHRRGPDEYRVRVRSGRRRCPRRLCRRPRPLR